MTAAPGFTDRPGPDPCRFFFKKTIRLKGLLRHWPERKDTFTGSTGTNIDGRRKTSQGIMCGRYSLICIDDLGKRFRVFDPSLGCKSKFNVAPSQLMPVVVHREKNEMVMMQWGLIPHSVKNPQDSPHPINARAETLAETPLFRDLLPGNRCLVPASGFYEWLNEGRRKVPFYIHMKDRPVVAFAGLYDIWQDCYGEPYPTFTIVTTDANSVVSRLHERMPVILREEEEERWLAGPAPSASEMRQILRPYRPEEMEAYPVSSRVNSPAVDDEELIRPLATLG